MAKHLISFGHGYSKAGAYDSGCTHGGFSEQEMVRRLKPYLKKWAEKAGLQVEFYDQNMFADRSVGNYKGYIVTEVHLDAPSGYGGHVIISSQFDPDDTDKRLAAFIAKHFGTVGYVGADGINQRSDLYNLNVCANAGINYRLIELFFLSNDVDRNHYLNDMDAVAKDFVEALAGSEVTGTTTTVAPAPAPAPTPAPAPANKWVSESGTFAPYFAINVRSAPNTSAGIVATYNKGQSVRYDSYYNDGRYVWIHYKSYSGHDRYMVCRESGTAWGSFS